MIRQWQSIRTQPVSRFGCITHLERDQFTGKPSEPTPEQLADDGRIDGIPARLAEAGTLHRSVLSHANRIHLLGLEGKGGGRHGDRPCWANGTKHASLRDAAYAHGIDTTRLRNFFYHHSAICINGVTFCRTRPDKRVKAHIPHPKRTGRL